MANSSEEKYEETIQHMIEEEKKNLQENHESIDSFKEFCKKKDIPLAGENFRYIQNTGIVATFPNIVSVLCPDLRKDKEGLLDFKMLAEHFEIKQFKSGFLHSEKFALMPHYYFRKGLDPDSDFVPDGFIDLFWNFKAPEITPSIAIDYDRVCINVEGTRYSEKATFGAKFNREINLVPDGIAHLEVPSDLEQFIFLFNGAYSLDIKWETKNGIKSFQSEEFKTEEYIVNKNGTDFHPVGYIHAEFDLVKKHFVHLDGAIHFYTYDQYLIRRDSDLNYNIKNSVQIKPYSAKLFRMDGNMSVDTWAKFVSYFMPGNPLVTEYFEGK